MQAYFQMYFAVVAVRCVGIQRFVGLHQLAVPLTVVKPIDQSVDCRQLQVYLCLCSAATTSMDSHPRPRH